MPELDHLPFLNATWDEALGRQFGAAMDMLDDALRACPAALWGDRAQRPEYWYVAYHTLFWLDLYLSGDVAGFTPPAPFTLDELNPAGVLPERVYSQAELQTYLQYCRQKCQATLASLTAAQAQRPCLFGWGNQLTFGELLLYNLRHVQAHAAELGLILGQKYGSGPGWVARARSAPGRAERS
jgi:hypothetical protein